MHRIEVTWSEEDILALVRSLRRIPESQMEAKDTVTMTRGSETAEVSPDDSIRIMQEQGWELADGGTGTVKKASDGLTVPQLKEALVAKNIAIPEGAKKPELAALLDAAAGNT